MSFSSLKLTTLSVYLFFAVFVAGCAGVGQNIAQDYKLSGVKQNGIAVVSLTRSGNMDCSLYYNLRGVDNKYDFLLPIYSESIGYDENLLKSLEELSGRLAVFELPQGIYEFYGWEGYGIDRGDRNKIKPRVAFSKRFKVVAGSVVYLGNLHIALSRSNYKMMVFDMKERDLKALKEKNPRISQSDIIVAVMK